MRFHKIIRNEDSPKRIVYAVYMDLNGEQHYVCDMMDGDSEEAKKINELGLTLRARLTRSRGTYAMLEGVVFDPFRLISAACDISGYTKETFSGGLYKLGYTLLTITADNCVNKYLIFNENTLSSLVSDLEDKKNEK